MFDRSFNWILREICYDTKDYFWQEKYNCQYKQWKWLNYINQMSTFLTQYHLQRCFTSDCCQSHYLKSLENEFNIYHCSDLSLVQKTGTSAIYSKPRMFPTNLDTSPLLFCFHSQINVIHDVLSNEANSFTEHKLFTRPANISILNIRQ